MSSPVSSLTASRSSSPEPCVQPDHFYGDASHLPPSPDSDKAYLSPEDDPLAHRGIPVFKPSMAEFADFEGYMNRVECWGRRSGIVKVVPPPEWTAALPDVSGQLTGVKIKSPIEQFMRGRAGLFRQENVEKRKLMSVREWAELCAKDEFRAPGKDQVGVHNNPSAQSAPLRRRKKQTQPKDKQPEVKDEQPDVAMASPPNSPSPDPDDSKDQHDTDSKPDIDSKPDANTKARNRRLERADKDASFLQSFRPHNDWLPQGTTAADYTPEFCAKLERAFWRNCGLGKPAWYGADTMGSLFLSSTTAWNVASLPSTLSRLLPQSTGLPGVNTPYLYFGMWRATFAWHVEDMDLFSINYIHFGAPKFWYAVPQARAGALEDTMRGYFPKDTSQCPQFLRHKSFLASPTLLSQSAVRPNHLVQHAGEFVITYPRGYHAGFNLGLNCAESVNFALDSWLDEGRKAAVCKCVDFSVRIDVDQLLEDRRIEALEKTDPAAAARARAVRDGLEDVDAELELASATASASAPDPQQHKPTKPHPTPETAVKRSPRKRKPTAPFEIEPDAKRARTVSASSSSHSRAQPKPITINLAARPLAPVPYASSSSSFHAHPQPHAHAHAPAQKLTLKLGPRPASLPSGASSPLAEETFPCCLCVDPSSTGLARVHDLPPMWRELAPAARLHFPQQRPTGVWMAHEGCAMVLPETWVDEIDGERVVFGVDGIVRGRWSLKCSACARARLKAHGALIQCAKGKCPKAFHVTCAQNGARTGTGIAYTVVRDVEKEVVLLEPAPGTDPNAPLQADEPNLRVLKVIRKTEVEALCAQHNPVIVAERRASKAEGLRADILALAPLSRIKVRVSAGVFEVTLVRVYEERRSVEVLWDAAGEMRELKWGAVILGQTSLPTMQLPDFNANPLKSAPNANVYAAAGPSTSTSARPTAPDAHGYWANAARQNMITIPAAGSSSRVSTASTSTPNPQHQAALAPHPEAQAQAQPHSQTQQHNPYSVFKYEYWPPGYAYPGAAGAGAGGSVYSPPAAGTHGQSASSAVYPSAAGTANPTNPSASTSTTMNTDTGSANHAAGPAPATHYVPMNQYYTGPQPWSSQYYRPTQAQAQAYYTQYTSQGQNAAGHSPAAPALNSNPNPTPVTVSIPTPPPTSNSAAPQPPVAMPADVHRVTPVPVRPTPAPSSAPPASDPPTIAFAPDPASAPSPVPTSAMQVDAPGPTPPASNLTIASAPNPAPSPVSMQSSPAMQVDVPPVAA